MSDKPKKWRPKGVAERAEPEARTEDAAPMRKLSSIRKKADVESDAPKDGGEKDTRWDSTSRARRSRMYPRMFK